MDFFERISYSSYFANLHRSVCNDSTGAQLDLKNTSANNSLAKDDLLGQVVKQALG